MDSFLIQNYMSRKLHIRSMTTPMTHVTEQDEFRLEPIQGQFNITFKYIYKIHSSSKRLASQITISNVVYINRMCSLGIYSLHTIQYSHFL